MISCELYDDLDRAYHINDDKCAQLLMRWRLLQAYVLRVCNVLDRVRKPLSDGGAFQESDQEREARIERVNGKIKINIKVKSPAQIM